LISYPPVSGARVHTGKFGYYTRIIPMY